MGDGPFREPQEAPKTKATYGQVAPAFGNGPKPDPYFNPEGGTPSRAKPNLDGPAPIFKPPGGQQGDPPAGGQQVAKPAEQPKWEKPKDAPTWKDPQPYGNTGDKGTRELEQAVGSKAKKLIDARDLQVGSTTANSLIGGTASALLTEPLTYGLGKGTEKMAANEGSRMAQLANLYRNNYDPIGVKSYEIAKASKQTQVAFEGLKTTLTRDESLLKVLQSKGVMTADDTAHLASLQKGLKLTDNEAVIKVLLDRKAKFPTVEALENMGGPKTKALLDGIADFESTTGRDILTKTERQLLTDRHKSLGAAADARAAREVAETEAKLWTKEGAMKNGWRGLWMTGVTGSVLSADHYVRDRMYGVDAKSWETTSLTVPLALALGGGWKSRSLLTVGALAGGHFVDTEIPAPDWIPAPLKRFTAFDAASLAVAFALPAKGKIARTALVGAGWAIGNTMEWGLSRESAGDIETTALNSVGNDKKDRSYSSMQTATDKFKELGQKNEVVLEQNLSGVIVQSQKNYTTMSQEEKLNAHRATVAMSRALGEYRMENGTRLSAKATDRPTYILKGLDLDLGGDALTFLQMAKRSTDGAKAMTEIMMGKQANGTVVNQQEVKDLDKVGTKIDADMNKILGKHDMQKALDQLERFIDKGTTNNSATFNKELAFYKTFIEEFNVKIANNLTRVVNPDQSINKDAALITAKLLRDQALTKMAQAAYKLDHGDDPIGAGKEIFGTDQGRQEWLAGTQTPKGFDGVFDELRMANQLAPDNPDMAELVAIANRLAQQVKAKTQGQYDKFDILNVQGR